MSCVGRSGHSLPTSSREAIPREKTIRREEGAETSSRNEPKNLVKSV